MWLKNIAYLRHHKNGPPFVKLDDYELGIVSSQAPEIAHAISALLSSSLEDAKNSNGGHLPPFIVERIKNNIISPQGVANIWGTTGHRFVLSRPAPHGLREIVATVLISQVPERIFFFTGRYNNLLESELETHIDRHSPEGLRWFNNFIFPPLPDFKPKGYHQIANFVVKKSQRGKGLGRFFIDNIIAHYAACRLSEAPKHAQALLSGCGLWQLGDPPWLARMQKLNFYLRGGAESFFIESPENPLPKIYSPDGDIINNINYNNSFGLPERYETWQPSGNVPHLLSRIPEVRALAQNPNAKLQYFQIIKDFI